MGMSSAGSAITILFEIILGAVGMLLILVALFFYTIHLDIEDAMEGICNSGDIILEVLTYEDCNDASQASNRYRSVAIGAGFFGLLFIIGSQQSYSTRQTTLPDKPSLKETNKMFVDGRWVPDPSFKAVNVAPPNTTPSQGVATVSKAEEGTRATPGVSTVPQDSSDKIMQIEKLGELKDKGLLTEEEFQKEKNKIL